MGPRREYLLEIVSVLSTHALDSSYTRLADLTNVSVRELLGPCQRADSASHSDAALVCTRSPHTGVCSAPRIKAQQRRQGVRPAAQQGPLSAAERLGQNQVPGSGASIPHPRLQGLG